MNNLNKIEQNLMIILTKNPALIDIKRQRELIWEYWKTFDDLKWGLSKEMWMFRATNPDYITRALRKLRVKNKEVDDPKRYELEKDFIKNNI